MKFVEWYCRRLPSRNGRGIAWDATARDATSFRCNLLASYLIDTLFPTAVCFRVCVCVWTLVHVSIYLSVSLSVFLSVSMSVSMSVCVYTRVRACTISTHTRARTHTHATNTLCVYACTHTHTCSDDSDPWLGVLGCVVASLHVTGV